MANVAIINEQPNSKDIFCSKLQNTNLSNSNA